MTHHAEDHVTLKAHSETDVAYLAGLLDGEGYFGTGPRFKATGRNRALPIIKVSMTDKTALLWCFDTFGGKFGKRGLSPTGRIVWEWCVTRNEDLRYLLPRLLPHLRVKGGQAWALLRVVETCRAQPKATRRNPGPRIERVFRRELRLRWRYDVAMAQAGVLSARQALSDINPKRSAPATASS